MQNIFLAHIGQIASAVQDTIDSALPVVGTPAEALVIALIFTFVVLSFYLIVDHLPKTRKNPISAKNEPTYAKAVIAFVILGMMSTGWDVWWHRAIGRDTFWTPPHIGLYLFAALSVAVSFYVWRHCRDKTWKHIIFVLMFIPISASFDNFFHALWGVENYSTPIKLSWSPGHVLLSVSVAVALILLLRILTKFRKTHDFSFFGNLCFGAIYSIMVFLLMPFHPTEGWGQVAGFAGAGTLALAYVVVTLTAQRVMKGRIDATFMVIMALILILVSYGRETAQQIIMMPHERVPNWLMMFSLLVPAILLDITRDRIPMWIRGMFAGTLWAAITFGFATYFFAPQFQYGLTEISTAIVFSALGGLVAASVFGIFHLDDEKHIEKLLKKW